MNPFAPSHAWADLTTQDFVRMDEAQRARVIAVLPLGATEQHGPHLPLSVDHDLVNGVVAASLPHLGDLPVLFLPTQDVGFSPEHQAYPGTLTLPASLVIGLWTALGESVARAGVRKLVLLNAHGGQVGLLDVVARDLRARLGVLVYSVNTFNLPLPPEVDGLFSAQEHRYGIHAGQIETAMMLALTPQRVRMAQARRFDSASQARAARFPILGNGRSAKLAWQMQDYNPAGAVGDAAAATAEQGHALLEAQGRALAALLDEIDRLPANTLVEGPLA
ncbi:creatininase family protein [Hylemonella gracilis]|nr:creatininase family protein [Hylemonella gracilis]